MLDSHFSNFLESVVLPRVIKDITPSVEKAVVQKCQQKLDEFMEVSEQAIDDFYTDYQHGSYHYKYYKEGFFTTPYAINSLIFERTFTLHGSIKPIPVQKIAPNKYRFGVMEDPSGVVTQRLWSNPDQADYVMNGAINLGYHGTSDIAVTTPPYEKIRNWWLSQSTL